MDIIQNFINVLRQMIEISNEELEQFLPLAEVRAYRRHSIVSAPEKVPQEVFFIQKGLVRVLVVDRDGVEQTIHFAMENQFIADYACFILEKPSIYTLQALEDTQTVVLPRNAIDWGYTHLAQGQKLGRLVAEFYFIYQDQRIQNMYARTPKERYDSISDIFPNIHQRVPQHMIASYLGITPVHLSRLKKSG